MDTMIAGSCNTMNLLLSEHPSTATMSAELQVTDPASHMPGPGVVGGGVSRPHAPPLPTLTHRLSRHHYPQVDDITLARVHEVTLDLGVTVALLCYPHLFAFIPERECTRRRKNRSANSALTGMQVGDTVAVRIVTVDKKDEGEFIDASLVNVSSKHLRSARSEYSNQQAVLTILADVAATCGATVTTLVESIAQPLAMEYDSVYVGLAYDRLVNPATANILAHLPQSIRDALTDTLMTALPKPRAIKTVDKYQQAMRQSTAIHTRTRTRISSTTSRNVATPLSQAVSAPSATSYTADDVRAAVQGHSQRARATQISSGDPADQDTISNQQGHGQGQGQVLDELDEILAEVGTSELYMSYARAVLQSTNPGAPGDQIVPTERSQETPAERCENNQSTDLEYIPSIACHGTSDLLALITVPLAFQDDDMFSEIHELVVEGVAKSRIMLMEDITAHVRAETVTMWKCHPERRHRPIHHCLRPIVTALVQTAFAQHSGSGREFRRIMLAWGPVLTHFNKNVSLQSQIDLVNCISEACLSDPTHKAGDYFQDILYTCYDEAVDLIDSEALLAWKRLASFGDRSPRTSLDSLSDGYKEGEGKRDPYSLALAAASFFTWLERDDDDSDTDEEV